MLFRYPIGLLKDDIKWQGDLACKKSTAYKELHGITSPSILPLSAVLFQLLFNPRSGQAQAQAQKAISNFSLGTAIPKVSSMKPEECL